MALAFGSVLALPAISSASAFNWSNAHVDGANNFWDGACPSNSTCVAS
ncbi:MAG TPA: hypothetical protein VNF07_12885 [Acidimicrobiales bacterium]|nr:hypothetical protein [Acidimicrobiales bacterium]